MRSAFVSRGWSGEGWNTSPKPWHLRKFRFACPLRPDPRNAHHRRPPRSPSPRRPPPTPRRRPSPPCSPSADARFGDYQTNIAMVLAKQRRTNPRQLAQEIIAKLDVAEICAPPEIAGRRVHQFPAATRVAGAALHRVARGCRSARRRSRAEQPRTLVIDFSSPNVAKPMHVGHIRSTILGDALARIAAFVGQRVIRDNHIGDWGTQFGMLLLGWKTELNREALAGDPLDEMERLYKLISARCKEDPATLEAARAELVKLQAGDEENLALWHEMIRLSQAQFEDDLRASRRALRRDARRELLQSAAQADRGGVARAPGSPARARARCAFSPMAQLPKEQDPFLIKEQEGWRDNPALVRKSDGAANYTTTDLATLRYRRETWAPDEIVYVTDGRQQLHFRQLFAIFAAGSRRPRRPRGSRTSGLARSSARTASPSKRARARRCAWPSCSMKRRSAPQDRDGEEPRDAAGGSARDRPARRPRRREIRRPAAEPAERLRLLVGPDAFAPGQYRAVPAKCLRAHPLDLSQGGRGGRGNRSGRRGGGALDASRRRSRSRRSCCSLARSCRRCWRITGRISSRITSSSWRIPSTASSRLAPS